MRRPVIVTEIAVGGAGSDDQLVVAESLAVGQLDLARGRVHAHDLAQQGGQIALAAEQAARRRGDRRRRQPGGGHLVEQGLEQMVVGLVDEGDVDVRMAQGLGGFQATETAADDQYMGSGHGPMLMLRCSKVMQILPRRASTCA
jgi:hypothetical protein